MSCLVLSRGRGRRWEGILHFSLPEKRCGELSYEIALSSCGIHTIIRSEVGKGAFFEGIRIKGRRTFLLWRIGTRRGFTKEDRETEKGVCIQHRHRKKGHHFHHLSQSTTLRPFKEEVGEGGRAPSRSKNDIADVREKECITTKNHTTLPYALSFYLC